MIEVHYLILARHAEPTSDGAFNALGAGMAGLVVTALPAVFPIFYVLSKVIFEQEDLDREHIMGLRVLDPTGETIAGYSQVAVPYEEKLAPDRPFLHANSTLGLHNLLFKTEGVYRFELILDGEVAKTARFRIELQPPLESAQLPPPEGQVE